MTDPTPFLSTVIATSAGMVAIVGGLLVARFISLESEQQGAQRLVEEAEGRLGRAQERVRDAADDLRRYLAGAFLNKQIVLKAIADGVTDADELRSLGDGCPLTDEELTPFIQEYQAEYEEAVQALDSAIDHPAKLSPSQWDTLRDWDRARQQFPLIPPGPARPRLWEVALERIIDAHQQLAVERETEREEQERKLLESQGIKGLAGFMAMQQRTLSVPFSAVRPRMVSVPELANLQPAMRYDALRSAVDRAQQQVEDIELELKRFRQRRDAIVKPGRQLWPGLIVLGVLSLLGVLIPLYVMSGGPKDFSPCIKRLYWLFCLAYVFLIAYFVWFAWRLSRSRKP